MKSLSDLNTKWWYRLLKVLFVLAFLLVAILSAFIVYQLNRSYRAADWSITCDYGNHSTFNALHDKSISISAFDPDKVVPVSTDTQIKAACGITQADLQSAQKATNEGIADIKSKCAKGNPFWGNCNNISYEARLYEIGATVVHVPTPWNAFGTALLAIFITVCVFEIIRRAFYYIALGKIRPSK